MSRGMTATAAPHTPARRSLAIPHVPAAAVAFAATLDRRADRLLAEGRTVLAERLAHIAAEARAQAEGCSA